MSNEKVLELLERWDDLNSQGRQIAVEELCQECPELAREVANRIKALQATEWLDEPVGNGIEDAGSKTTPDELGLPPKLGRYELKRLVGEGGFGYVLEAHDPELQRSVAVKVARPGRMASPEQASRFLNEARHVAQLKHPSIVPIHDVGREGDFFYIVSDLVDGENLAALITRKQLSVHEAARIAHCIADALHHAHENEFVHRDIKPANILISKNGSVFLTDFGITATRKELEDGSVLSEGTLAYMAPEQLAPDSQQVGTRSDIYSLGVVLYEMITGEPLFRADTPVALRERILDGADGLPKMDAPKPLARICRKCLTRNPQDRYLTAKALAKDLDSYLMSDGKRPVGWIVLLVVVALVVPTAIWIGLQQSKQPQQSKEPQTTMQPSVTTPIDIGLPQAHVDVAQMVVKKHGFIICQDGPQIDELSEIPQPPFAIWLVSLRETSVEGDDLALIAELPTVTSLNLTATPIGDDDLAHVARMERLGELRLNSTQVTDAGMRHLLPLRELELLELRDTQISDDGVAQLSGMKSLKKVVLVGTRITDDCIQHLAQLKQLVELRISRTQVTEQGANRLRTELPGCKVVR